MMSGRCFEFETVECRVAKFTDNGDPGALKGRRMATAARCRVVHVSALCLSASMSAAWVLVAVAR